MRVSCAVRVSSLSVDSSRNLEDVSERDPSSSGLEVSAEMLDRYTHTENIPSDIREKNLMFVGSAVGTAVLEVMLCDIITSV